jgi:hypothetical protein
MVAGLIAPFAKLLNDLLGPGAEEFGLAIKDQVQFFRLERYRRLMERSQQMFESAHKKPDPIPLRLLLPILENGSLEEDDELQDRWAALLVNSSGENRLIPGAADILKQLSPYEVLVLQMCYDFVTIDYYGFPDLDKKPLNGMFRNWYIVLVEKHNFKQPSLGHVRDLEVMTDNLTRLGLIVNGKTENTLKLTYMTRLGFEFISLCQTHL